MKTRRDFIKVSAIGSAAILSSSAFGSDQQTEKNKSKKTVNKPIVLSTWNHGLEANKGAWKILETGGSALDAVEQGVRVTESDFTNLSVGLGGLPDRDGNTTLDACIMDHRNRCGSVGFLQNIENPISVARKVMEDTPHIMLVGDGAYEFAISKGFPRNEFKSEKAQEAWQEWLKTSEYKPIINRENHDTIGMIALDNNGNLSGACTTSGLSYKMRGRLGDSPIIGAGLFVDNEVGAACATGLGEAVIRIAGSAIIVEMMRCGMSPQEVCKAAVERLIVKHENKVENLQVGFIALNKFGEWGCYSVYSGFNVAHRDINTEKLVDAEYNRPW
ncbi:MAG: N(4)-(beta-N-acetylglucosaminyl)-L-asparaginase [Crocinitomicaceae bacterium]|nr:N(4)-(beta-N-acetylglucosaminyl)-L-asparaginase [Crocinitomicaceae bacterium]